MSEPKVSDRRPLKTRSWPLFQITAARLAKSGVTPNAISVASIAFAIVGATGLAMTGLVESGAMVRVGWLVAVLGIQGRLIANLLDGMVAVEGGKASAVGPLYNEVPDRISDPILLVAAGYAATGDPLAGWAAAVMAMFVAYTRSISASVGAGQLFLGPMAKPQRMALLTTICAAGVVLPTPWMMTAGFGMMQIALWVMVVGCVVTAARRLNQAAKFLKSQGE
ncbi:CDP-alcohol phosphatidyltransferase [Planctomycetes bacterium CA13]|uniref:CDP-alcohol phosphatidyltransferase n=1 Tax=Novipirellula herctigrandis TaxID=2527986 RepID=A0A5C5Z1N6_9BACT|nr:CDP-alcohol phosphatidyltransferase [Planctomycetes bacterium CA13]